MKRKTTNLHRHNLLLIIDYTIVKPDLESKSNKNSSYTVNIMICKKYSKAALVCGGYFLILRLLIILCFIHDYFLSGKNLLILILK